MREQQTLERYWALLGEQQAVMITASNRQSRHWQQRYNQWQSRERDVWPSATILSFSQWQQRLFQSFSQELADPLIVSENIELQVLLNKQQSLWLWESILRKHDVADFLISIKATASKAYEAWQLLKQWQLSIDQVFPETQDHYAFVRWAKDYQEQLNKNHWIDESGLLDWLMQQLPDSDQQSALCNSLLLPKHLLLLGFHQLTPQQEQWLDLLKSLGITIEFIKHEEPKNKQIKAYVAADFNSELLAATAWVKRAITESPNGQFAVVVPNLDKTRYQVQQLFMQQLHPECLMDPAPDRLAFNVSVGEPIKSFPMTRIALHLIALLGQEITANQWAEVLRSDLIDIWRKFQVSHRELAFHLVDNNIRCWRLEGLIRWMGEEMMTASKDSQPFLQRLDTIKQFQKSVKQHMSPEKWSAVFMEWLTLWGWPGEKTLSSREFQLYEQLTQKIQSLRQYNTLHDQCTFNQALSHLRTDVDGESYQAKSHGEPIQVLGLYEAAGITFDGVWLSGLSNEVLPDTARPNPFLPLSLAKKYVLPGSGPERELEFAKSLLDQLINTSDCISVSYHQQKQEQVLGASPLLEPLVKDWQSAMPEENLLLSTPKVATDYFSDDWGMPYEASELVGGSSFLNAQSVCPMQGYLSFRLQLEEQSSEPVGIDPRERGIFVHQVMQKIWLKLQDQDTLLAQSDAELYSLIESVISQLLYSRFKHNGLLKQLEQEKFIPLIFRLLQLETKRRGFKVVATEQKVTIPLNGLLINARLDRIDQHDDGDKMVLDYKTGQATISQWFANRLGEPQLPLYLLSDKENIRGLCFARLHHKEVKMMGVTEASETIPGIKAIQDAKLPVSSWQEFIEQMETGLLDITDEIKKGYAAVEPVSSLLACQYCPFDSVCRIGELDENPIEGRAKSNPSLASADKPSETE